MLCGFYLGTAKARRGRMVWCAYVRMWNNVRKGIIAGYLGTEVHRLRVGSPPYNGIWRTYNKRKLVLCSRRRFAAAGGALVCWVSMVAADLSKDLWKRSSDKRWCKMQMLQV